MPDFFVPGFGISRRVIESNIRYYCGPEAIARPYVLQGRDGFLVTSVGPALTQVATNLHARQIRGIDHDLKAQIDDLKEASRRYEEQRAQSPQSVNAPVTIQPGTKRE